MNLLKLFIPMAERALQRVTDKRIKAKIRRRLERWKKELHTLNNNQ